MTFPLRSIDLNADVGEIPALAADGSEARLIAAVSSVNIACGGHAGDMVSVETAVRAAIAHGVAIGAHPSYPDRENFGRVVMDITHHDLMLDLRRQVVSLMSVAAEQGAVVHHVKPHGALYNAAIDDAALAATIAKPLAEWRGTLTLVGLAGSAMLDVWRSMGFDVAGEAFADRRYEPDGRLRDRRHPDALIDDPEEAARQAVQLAVHGTVTAGDGTVIPCRADTFCLHGDQPGALARVVAVRRALEGAGVTVASLGR
jgi:UPF0271 protein